MSHCESYRRVVSRVLECTHEWTNLDGADIQELLETEGIIHPVEVTERCKQENCVCAEYEFPATCYRLTEAGKHAEGAHKRPHTKNQ